MKLLSSSSLLLLIHNFGNCNGQSHPKRTFVDDAGITHKIWKAQPKIICSARTALSFHHQFHMSTFQFAGTYGNYFPRGSIGDMHDPDYQPYWPTDPTPNELAFLEQIPTFSPSCYHAKRTKCDEIDIQMVSDAKPDMWVYVDNGNWHTGEDMKSIMNSMGNLPIFISTQFEGDKNPGCITFNKETATYDIQADKCKTRSLLDVIKRTNELANFLGVPKIDITKDQQEFCDASKALTDAALSAQLRGIRVMTISPSISEDNAVTVYFNDPLHDPFLRSYEELGVPIIHPGKHPSAQIGAEKIPSSEWFTDCTPGQMYKNCNGNAYYPVDLFLVEGRRFFFNTPEEQYFLQTFFPDKALLKNQIAHWPLNDGAISYTGAARSFEEMTRKLNEAVQQYDSTQCVNADVTSNSFLNAAFGGLKGGEYACYNKNTLQSDYTNCKEDDLAGGEQLVTTSTEKKEPEFKPLVSDPFSSEKTRAKQTMRTQWSDKDTAQKQRASLNAVVALIAVVSIVIFTGIFSCIIYCCCWKGRSSTTIEKSTVEEEIGTGGDLPSIA